VIKVPDREVIDREIEEVLSQVGLSGKDLTQFKTQLFEAYVSGFTDEVEDNPYEPLPGYLIYLVYRQGTTRASLETAIERMQPDVPRDREPATVRYLSDARPGRDTTSDGGSADHRPGRER
jgi:hypothetical protein